MVFDILLTSCGEIGINWKGSWENYSRILAGQQTRGYFVNKTEIRDGGGRPDTKMGQLRLEWGIWKSTRSWRRGS